jgi:hypothetical protein
VAEFLTRHSGEVAAIEAHVLGSEPITWANDLQGGHEAPIPPLTAHRSLQTVLLARALVAARSGDDPAAERALAASWRLGLVLRERPEILSQLLAAALAGSYNGVVRRIRSRRRAHVGAPAPDWRQGMVRSMQVEAWMFETTATRTAAEALDEKPVVRSIGSGGCPTACWLAAASSCAADFSTTCGA